MFESFENYLIVVGIRSHEYGYTEEQLFKEIEHFRECYEIGLSPYKALLFLYDLD